LNRVHYILLFMLMILATWLSHAAIAQENSPGFVVKGKVTCDDMDVAGIAQVFIENSAKSTVIDEQGQYKLEGLTPGDYTLVVYAYEHQTQKKKLTVNSDMHVDFHLHELHETLEDVEVHAKKAHEFGLHRMNAVEGMGIYEGKKSEVLVVEDIIANKATNNARQVFSRISGLNIWESDCAGIQLGVGGRGLSPSRSSNFNTRQNGIEMSADALGYPESYYSPPIQAVERIEVVRGAASLQYGTQFGGLINFDLKDAPEDKKVAVESSQTYGQYDYFNSYNSVAGTLGQFNYFTYYQYRKGDCWRCNSEFDAHTAYAKVGYQITPDWSVSADYSFMRYIARQPGGLTDAQFEENPRASYRDRNWFRVNWNLMSLNMDYKISSYTRINSRFFGLIANRAALGNLNRIDRPDDEELDRTLIDGTFENIGNETRLLHRYNLIGNISSFLVGFRIYQGNSFNTSGAAPNGSGKDFHYINDDSVNFDYFNQGQNLAIFAENIFTITDKFSITPGIRFEHIRTSSDGYFRKPMPTDLAGNPLLPDSVDLREFSDISNPRRFLLFGLGMSFKPGAQTEIYGNFSQNYKSISYSDIRVTVPTLQVDPDITDEHGYSIDLGIRGNMDQTLNYEATAFLLRYKNRIGSILKRDDAFSVYRYRSNVGDATNFGLETFAELDFIKWLKPEWEASLSYFSNLTYLHTRYTDASPQIKGNQVEFSPAVNLRTGITFKRQNLGITAQLSYLSDQYTDATNASNDPPVPGAVEGTIPAYYVADVTAEYSFLSWLEMSVSVNNVTNNMYFTRRATGYPGPGIIPSDGRNYYVTITGRF